MLRKDQPVILQLLEIPDEGPKRPEGRDHGTGRLRLPCCWLVSKPTATPHDRLQDTDYALLVGARPRGPGMER